MMTPHDSNSRDFHALRGIIDPLPVGVVVFDPEGLPLIVNRIARDLLGEVATTPLANWSESGRFFSPRGETAVAMDIPPCLTLLDGEIRSERELYFQGHTGSSTPLLVSSRAVRDPEGHVLQVTCTLTPIGECRRRWEGERAEQLLDAMSTSVGGVAGPLNDALTAITGYCDLARSRLDDADPFCGVLEEIRQAGDRATVLTGRLLANSRREVVCPEVIDIDRWLSTHVTILRTFVGNGAELEIEPASSGACVRVDPRLLEQILAELLANARDAIPHGGRIRVATAPVRLDPAIAGILGDDAGASSVVLTVSDTGGGLAEPVLRRVFEPFFTTKPHALGLGLTTVERLIRAQRGHIRVENRRGEGVSFHIHLPRSTIPVSETPVEPSGRTATVLLVEDDVVVRDVVRQTLETEHLNVIHAQDAAHADRLLGAPDAPTPDLLVCDVVMPGEGGPSLATRLVNRYPGLGVLFVSGCNDPVLLGPLVAVGQTAFLPKPFAPEQLLTRVRRLLAARPRRLAAARAQMVTLHPSV